MCYPHVSPVPYWEWDEVVTSSQRTNEYLVSLLDGLADSLTPIFR